jgi:dTDP-glucose 4,6-dehydratase
MSLSTDASPDTDASADATSSPPQRHQPEAVLVTGGAGFIGSNFLLRMVPRYPDVTFVNYDRLTYAGNLMNLRAIEDAENYHFVQGDVTDREQLADVFDTFGITTVVHFAAESHVDRSISAPMAFVQTNTVGTVTLLEAARAAWPEDAAPARYRLHHVSTDEVFGSLGPDDPPFDEDTAYDPRSPYSASKAASDHFVRAYHHTYGLPVVLSNCTNNYGPYQFPEKLIPLVIQNAIDEEPVPVYGSGENVRDWLYVEDHAAALERILHSGRSGVTYAVGGDCEKSNIALVRQLLDRVDEALGRPPESSRQLITFVEDRPGHDFRYAMDFSRLRDELDWTPTHTLEEGLRATVDWYLNHRDWLAAVRDNSYQDYYDDQYGERLASS